MSTHNTKTFFLAICVLIISGCTSHHRMLLPPEINVGEFSGPAGIYLSQELNRLQSPGPKQKNLTLSGQSSFNFETENQSETVRITKKGPVVQSIQTDPLTGQPWPVKEPILTEDSENFDLTQTNAILALDWTLKGTDGKLYGSGQLSESWNRSSGGFLAQEGLASQEAETSDIALQALTRAMAQQLLEALGPALGPRELIRGKDPLSKQASQLAREDRWDEAALLWQKLIEQNPIYTPPLYNLGLYHERAGRLEDAWNFYRRAFLSQNNPHNREALTRLTDTLRRQGLNPEPDSNLLTP